MSDTILLLVCHAAAIAAWCILWMLMIGIGLGETLNDQRYLWLHLAVLANIGAQFSPLRSLPQAVMLVLVAVSLAFWGAEMRRPMKKVEVFIGEQ